MADLGAVLERLKVERAKRDRAIRCAEHCYWTQVEGQGWIATNAFGGGAQADS